MRRAAAKKGSSWSYALGAAGVVAGVVAVCVGTLGVLVVLGLVGSDDVAGVVAWAPEGPPEPVPRAIRTSATTTAVTTSVTTTVMSRLCRLDVGCGPEGGAVAPGSVVMMVSP
jgi:hypothetical protein